MARILAPTVEGGAYRRLRVARRHPRRRAVAGAGNRGPTAEEVIETFRDEGLEIGEVQACRTLRGPEPDPKDLRGASELRHTVLGREFRRPCLHVPVLGGFGPGERILRGVRGRLRLLRLRRGQRAGTDRRRRARRIGRSVRWSTARDVRIVVDAVQKPEVESVSVTFFARRERVIP